jgi:hypothetical protein
MKCYQKRLLLAIGIFASLGIILAALTALGCSSASGSLGGSAPVTPYQFTPGKGLYLLSFSGELAGDYHGDVVVELAGTPPMDYRLMNLAPLRFFAQGQGDGLQQQTLVGLGPGDKVAVLVLAIPRRVKVEGFEAPIASCCVPPELLSSGTGHKLRPLTLKFLRADSGQPLLQIPVEFRQR